MLKYVSQALRSSREFMLGAVQMNGLCLAHAEVRTPGRVEGSVLSESGKGGVRVSGVRGWGDCQGHDHSEVHPRVLLCGFGETGKGERAKGTRESQSGGH